VKVGTAKTEENRPGGHDLRRDLLWVRRPRGLWRMEARLHPDVLLEQIDAPPAWRTIRR